MCFCFRRLSMRELIYPGDRYFGSEEVSFGVSLLFGETGRNDITLHFFNWRCFGYKEKFAGIFKELLCVCILHDPVIYFNGGK